LQKTLIHPQSIWNLPVPDYASGEKPRHLLPGLSGGDREMIFGAVPHVASALKYDPDVRAEVMAEVMEEQDKQSEMLMRILDLRNASRERINAVNRDRVVEEFGEGWNTGSSSVQGGSLALLIMENTDGWEAALMTTKIRGLNEHILANPKDVHNKRSLRMLVQKRARVLKYLKRTKPDEYERTLADIGLDRRTVEGELFIDL
jgi:small subunit ribosomal protein S15